MQENDIDDFIRLLKNLRDGITQIVKRHAKVDIVDKEQTRAHFDNNYQFIQTLSMLFVLDHR